MLTPRQKEVVDHLLNGDTNKEIANHLGISEATVKRHMTLILRNFHCTTRSGLVAAVLRQFYTERPAA